MLVEKDKKFRNTWMQSRPFRLLHPWKIAELLTIVNSTIIGQPWRGKRDLQDLFYESLQELSLKVDHTAYDSNNGGSRTWMVLLEALGLVFKDNGQYNYTKAGEDISLGKIPAPIIQTQLLNYQYPSLYSLKPNIKINPQIKIRPFTFILKFLLDDEILSLTDKEISILVAYGHNDECYSICKDKILKFRRTNDITTIINSPADLTTPRTLGRTFEKSLMDIKDIANTFKNNLIGAGLAKNTEFGIVADNIDRKQLESINESPFINTSNPIAFQRSYGAWDRVKDTRRLVAPKKDKDPERDAILRKFLIYMGENIVIEYPIEFIDQVVEGYGFSRSKVEETISPYLKHTLDYFESTYLELASSGKPSKATAFELATTQLFAERLQFKSIHTGLKKAKHVGGYADIFLVALTNEHCAIIDTKASGSYNLNSSDYHKMLSNYLPNYETLCDGQGLDLEFCAYIAGGFSGKLDSKLESLTRDSGVPATAIDARSFLNLCKRDSNDQVVVRELFRSNKKLTIN